MVKTRAELAVLLVLILAVCALATPQESDPKNLREIDSALQALRQVQAQVQAQQKKLEDERAELVSKTDTSPDLPSTPGVVDRSFPAYLVARIDGDQKIVLDMDGVETEILLAGVHVKMAYSREAARFLTSEARKGWPVLIRWASRTGGSAYIYKYKDQPSLNAQLIQRGWAMPLSDYDSEVAKAIGAAPSVQTSPVIETEPAQSSYRSTAGTDVQVRGYTRKDGTYVRPHTRSAPGRRKP